MQLKVASPWPNLRGVYVETDHFEGRPAYVKRSPAFNTIIRNTRDELSPAGVFAPEEMPPRRGFSFQPNSEAPPAGNSSCKSGTACTMQVGVLALCCTAAARYFAKDLPKAGVSCIESWHTARNIS